MKQILLILAVLLIATTYGQEKETPKAEKSFRRVLIGINFSPDINSRTMTVPDERYRWLYDAIKKTDAPKFGYTAGINVCFNITRLFGIETGIQYSNKGFGTKTQYFTSPPSPWPNGQNLYSKGRSAYSFHYISFPLKTNFTIGKGKVRFFTSAGVTVDVLVHSTSTIFLTQTNGTKEHHSSTIRGLSPLNISAIVSAGIDYKINDRMNLRIEPTFRHNTLKLLKTTTIKSYLWNAGLNISYYFGL